MAEVGLEAGEEIRAEAGAMVSYSGGIRMETNATGGFLKSLGRGPFGGELLQNTFTASEAGTVTFAPPLPGDVAHHRLDRARRGDGEDGLGCLRRDRHPDPASPSRGTQRSVRARTRPRRGRTPAAGTG